MKVEAQTTIRASIDDVFDVFTDLEHAKDRIQGIIDLEMIDPPAKMQVGTKWRETRVVFGKEADETMWVTELNRNRNYVVEAESHGTRYRSEYTFQEQSDQTLVSMTFEGTPLTFGARLGGILFVFFKKSTERLLTQDMQDLKMYLESSQK